MNGKTIIKALSLLFFCIVMGVLFFTLFAQKNSTPPQQRSAQIEQKTLQVTSENLPLQILTGYSINVFAENLNLPRDLELSPGGVLLASTPGNDTILAFPDRNKDGKTDEVITLISDLKTPHGLAFYKNKLYIASVDKVNRYTWDEKQLKAIFDKTVVSLPQNSNHINRTILFIDDQMYVSIGSTCNVCNEKNIWNGTIIVASPDGDNPHVFARGQRNAPFMTLNPKTQEIWATGMGRDYLGDNLPPDEINIIRKDTDYGWPLCYGKNVPDTNFDTLAKVSTCTNTMPPIYEIPAHSAPLGLTFITSPFFPSSWQGDLLVAYHGSWNKSTKTGYKIVHMSVNGNTITSVEDFLTGFEKDNDVFGRPVDLLFDASGNLFLSDDKGGRIYRVTKT